MESSIHLACKRGPSLQGRLESLHRFMDSSHGLIVLFTLHGAEGSEVSKSVILRLTCSDPRAS